LLTLRSLKWPPVASVGDSARADVVNGQHGIGLAEGDTAVDHLLTAPLHFGISALHGIKVEIFGLRSGGNGGGRAAAEADLHGGSAELNDQGGGGNVLFGHVFAFEIAHAAGGHDGFVVAAVASVVVELQGAEHAAELGTSEFIAEGRAADGAFDHDVEGRGHAGGVRCYVDFPGQFVAGDFQIGDHKGGEAGLGTSADPRGALVADFTAHAGAGTGEGGDGGGMVVGFDFAENIQNGGAFAVGFFRAGLIHFPPVAEHAFEHAGVVGIGNQGAFGMQLVGVADHGEQGFFAFLAVDHPVGIEDFVPAVFGVNLGEHDQFGIGGIAAHFLVGGDQIVDFIGAEGETPVDIGLFEGVGTVFHQRHRAQGGGFGMGKEIGEVVVDGFGHAVVEQEQGGAEIGGGEGPVAGLDVKVNAAFDAADVA
jgi:hypothetical protein